MQLWKWDKYILMRRRTKILAGWVGQNSRQGMKLKKKMAAVSGGESFLEIQAVAIFFPAKEHVCSNFLRNPKLKFYRVLIQ